MQLILFVKYRLCRLVALNLNEFLVGCEITSDSCLEWVLPKQDTQDHRIRLTCTPYAALCGWLNLNLLGLVKVFIRLIMF